MVKINRNITKIRSLHLLPNLSCIFLVQELCTLKNFHAVFYYPSQQMFTNNVCVKVLFLFAGGTCSCCVCLYHSQEPLWEEQLSSLWKLFGF